MDDYEDQFEYFPLADVSDNEIVMHCEAHFEGSFPTMIEYYENEKHGFQEHFPISRIKELESIQIESEENLASTLLSPSEIDKIEHAKKLYQQLRELCDMEGENTLPRRIAQLILSEEEDPVTEMKEVCQAGKKIVPFLTDLVRADHFYEALFPGQGRAPFLAIHCLGKIGHPQAIKPLFETLGKGDFFDDEIVIASLKEIGLPSKEFLLQVLHGKPLTHDNEKAALVLSAFEDDVEVAQTCLKMLQRPDVQKRPELCGYLIFSCSELKTPEDRKFFCKLGENPSFPPILQKEIFDVIEEWSEEKGSRL